jgi:hypothetical protein
MSKQQQNPTATPIGDIGNYYGDLWVKEEEGRFFWQIEDYCSNTPWSEIPESLYRALMDYEATREKS